MTNATQTERLKALLQPDVVAELGLLARGPVDLLQLREQVEQWRRSRSEQVAAPAPVVERVIALKPETWERLDRLAAQLAAPEAAVTPTQLAAWLVETGLAGLTDSQG
jgi:hypothetical protein